jgi:hypothetical protein
MNRVAAKIAQKVFVFFQNHHIDAGARQKIAANHAGGPTAGDHALGRELGHESSLSALRCVANAACMV